MSNKIEIDSEIYEMLIKNSKIKDEWEIMIINSFAQLLKCYIFFKIFNLFFSNVIGHRVSSVSKVTLGL